MAVLYFFITLPFILFMLIPMFITRHQLPGFPFVLIILLPFIYALFGFLFTIYGCAIYNQVAKWTGGFEYASDDAPEA